MSGLITIREAKQSSAPSAISSANNGCGINHDATKGHGGPGSMPRINQDLSEHVKALENEVARLSGVIADLELQRSSVDSARMKAEKQAELAAERQRQAEKRAHEADQRARAEALRRQQEVVQRARAEAEMAGRERVRLLARQVWSGAWGDGFERRRRLEASGYDYNRVQEEVNRTQPCDAHSKKTIQLLAKEVWQGKWGDGSERRRRLVAAGHDYNRVQEEVNRTSPS